MNIKNLTDAELVKRIDPRDPIQRELAQRLLIARANAIAIEHILRTTPVPPPVDKTFG